MPNASSCMFVLPRITAPSSTRRFTVGACSDGTKSRSPGVPAVLGKPATWVLSLMTSGTPWSTPFARLRASCVSACRAALSAPASSSGMNPLRSGLARAREIGLRELNARDLLVADHCRGVGNPELRDIDRASLSAGASGGRDDDDGQGDGGSTDEHGGLLRAFVPWRRDDARGEL